MDNNRSVASIDIAVGGAYGFSSHRVPGIVTTTSGKVLLYWEGRKNSTNERAVLLSTSCDGGKHFSPIQTLICGTEETFLHNPLMIAGPDDSVWFFWCENYRKLFVCKSSDGGQTFAEPRELTTFVEQFRNKWPMTLWAISPGHGICLRKILHWFFRFGSVVVRTHTFRHVLHAFTVTILEKHGKRLRLCVQQIRLEIRRRQL